MDGDNILAPGPISTTHVLHIGVTGHREGNASFDANRAGIEQAFGVLLDGIQRCLASDHSGVAPQIRLVTNVAHGSDLMAAECALERNMQVVAPLPFGRNFNLAINTPRAEWRSALALATGRATDEQAHAAHVDTYDRVLDAARCFALCDKDAALLAILETLAEHPDHADARRNFDILVTDRTALASRITIEQADFVVAIWDGMAASSRGGTRDTMAQALAAELPVLWIDAREPVRCHWLDDLGDLAVAREREEPVDHDTVLARIAAIAEENRAAIDNASARMAVADWQPRSARYFHSYRRIETMFAGEGRPMRSVLQTYEAPDAIANGSAAPLLAQLEALPGSDVSLIGNIRDAILPKFALADGMSTYLSDSYRGGMVASFLLSAAAIIAGVAYLPLVGPELKWPFAALELLLLLAIVAITIAGVRGDWHRRWFRTRRVAEYFRHAPIMLAIGCMRPKGHWPTSRDEQWPEIYARQVLMEAGLPDTQITSQYLRQHLREIMMPFVVAQRDYHRAKAARLEHVHHRLDRVSETLFVLAILSVGTYLGLKLLGALGLLDPSVPLAISKLMTFFGVALPTLGAAIAGIRYFGDFERFAAISDVTSEKLDRLIRRADLLLEGGRDEVGYADFVDLAHSMNDAMIEEIESWQSIFGTKKMSVPV